MNSIPMVLALVHRGLSSSDPVYRGILDGETETEVAVKVINLERRGASRSLLSECEALRNIRNQNLVKIITSCSSIDFSGHDFKAIVYEFMPNGSLEKWLYPDPGADDTRAMDFIQRLNIAIDIATAQNYLHNHCHSPIVHCDLKPRNVLLDDDMVAHVGDLGLAKFLIPIVSKDPGMSANSIRIKGFIGYVAPGYGFGGPVSTSGDVYSFGILLLELFTAKRPVDDMFRIGLTLHRFVKTALP